MTILSAPVGATVHLVDDTASTRYGTVVEPVGPAEQCAVRDPRGLVSAIVQWAPAFRRAEYVDDLAVVHWPEAS